MYCVVCLPQISMNARGLTDAIDAPTFLALTDVNAMMVTTTRQLPEPVMVSLMQWVEYVIQQLKIRQTLLISYMEPGFYLES